jgi:hypothetical protein
LSIKNFFKFCDLLDDKTVTSLLSKESNAKIQNCYSNLRDLLNKQSKSSYSDYFEQILSNLMSDESSASKKKEVIKSTFINKKKHSSYTTLIFF